MIGPNAGLPAIAEEARCEVVPNVGRLLAAARKADVTVVHCLVQRREDGRGSNTNARLFAAGKSFGADLDAVLRNIGVRTVVGVGVSVNVAIPNFVMDAVNRSYQFVLPRDAVSGFPLAYAEAVIDNTLALLSTVTTTDAVVAAWTERAVH